MRKIFLWCKLQTAYFVLNKNIIWIKSFDLCHFNCLAVESLLWFLTKSMELSSRIYVFGWYFVIVMSPILFHKFIRIFRLLHNIWLTWSANWKKKYFNQFNLISMMILDRIYISSPRSLTLKHLSDECCWQNGNKNKILVSLENKCEFYDKINHHMKWEKQNKITKQSAGFTRWRRATFLLSVFFLSVLNGIGELIDSQIFFTKHIYRWISMVFIVKNDIENWFEREKW